MFWISTYYVSGTVLGAEDASQGTRGDTIPILKSPWASWGCTHNHLNKYIFPVDHEVDLGSPGGAQPFTRANRYKPHESDAHLVSPQDFLGYRYFCISRWEEGTTSAYPNLGAAHLFWLSFALCENQGWGQHAIPLISLGWWASELFSADLCL